MTTEDRTGVLVVGAGPVGLLAALRLAEREVPTVVADSDRLTKNFSYALALHPRSLELLEELGLYKEIVAGGLVVNRVAILEGTKPLAELRLGELPGRFPFLVTAPQRLLEELLEKRLRERGVTISWNQRVADLREDDRGVVARLDRLDEVGTGYPYMRFERTVTGSRNLRASYVIGADGYHSFVRQSLGQEYRQLGPRESFCVFEFELEANPDLLQMVRVVLHGDTVNVLWPLPGNRMRWSFQVRPGDEPPLTTETFRNFIRERAPWFTAEPREITWRVLVEFEPRLVERFGAGARWLAGDAAHLTGPVGVQSMNVGLREARDLAELLAEVVHGRTTPDALERYNRERVAEWTELLGAGRALEAAGGGAGWSGAWKERLPALIPESGDALAALLGQLGLRWTRAR